MFGLFCVAKITGFKQTSITGCVYLELHQAAMSMYWAPLSTWE
jgi:hypothetical protein